MYSCGPTVYNHVHIGNLRTFAFQDILRRHLRQSGWKLLHVMNITDVEDKIIAAAAREGVPIKEFTQQYTEAFFEDCSTLRLERPERVPAATDHIPEMLSLVGRIESAGHTYRNAGSTYFRIASWSDYGKLSRLGRERHSRRGSRGRGRVRQGRCPGLRALEGRSPRGAELGRPVRAGAAGLAPRVLGHGDGVPWRVLRHPHRRSRPAVPASRERDRPVRERDRQAVRKVLAACRALAGGRQEDGQVAGELLHAPGLGLSRVRARRGSLPARGHALPQAAELHVRRAAGSRGRDREAP